MMQQGRVLIRASDRGKSETEWLTSSKCFSFGDYYNPELMHFGALRALNDELIAPHKGFSMHGHDNMEIITIPLNGCLLSQDDKENSVKIRAGCLEAVSAGSGVYHTEYNASSKESVGFLQIWLIPNVRNVTPHFQLMCYELEENKLCWIVTPQKSRETVRVHQDVWLSLGRFIAGESLNYPLHKTENGVFIFVIEGKISEHGLVLNRRDGLGLYHRETIDIEVEEASFLLLIEVPMKV